MSGQALFAVFGPETAGALPTTVCIAHGESVAQRIARRNFIAASKRTLPTLLDMLDQFDRRGVETWEPPIPMIEVMTYKESGKYYSGHTVPVKPEHFASIEAYEFMELLKRNDPSVQDYSPVTGGFTSHFSHAVNLYLPSKMKGFCTFLMYAKPDIA